MLSFRFAGASFVLLLYSTAIFQSCHAALNYLEDDGKYDDDFIVNFTRHLHNKYRFNGFVCFGENRESNRAPSLASRTLEQALVENFSLPIIVWGKNRTTKLLKNIGLNNLVFVNIGSIDDLNLEVVDYTLEGLHYIPMLFIYKSVQSAPPTKQQMRDFFNWCWDKNIVNVALTFKVDSHNQVYKYSPFPVITVFNLTNLIYTSEGDFIFDQITNTHGYQFKTPIQSNPPYVILAPRKLQQQRDSKYAITGTTGRVYEEFVNHINGTVKLMPQHNMSSYSFLAHNFLKAANKEIDIGVHPYSELLQYTKFTEGSYPIGWTNFCIIVPVVNEIKQSEYFISASMIKMRYLMLGMLLSLALLQVLCNKPFHVSFRRIGQALWNAFGMVLLQALPLTQLQNRRFRFAFFFVMAILLSMMLASIYTGSLTALYSKIVLGKQIKTIDDFLQSDLKILAKQMERKYYFESGHLPSVLMGHLHVTDPESLTEHRDSLNTSYAYVIQAEKWTMLNMKQHRLSVPRFRIAGSELCSPQFFLKFPVQWDSPFINTLALFSMYTQESGLSLKWDRETTHQIIELKLIDIIEDDFKHPLPITMSHMEKPLWLCLIMWMCSLLCFFGELIWHWWSVNRNREQQPQRRL